MRATDQEQIEMLKEFWKDYGQPIAIAVIIGLAVGFGWRYFTQHKIQQADKASMLYQAVINTDAKNDYNTAQKYAKMLIQKFNKTPYASMAALVWAHEAVEQKNLVQASTQLHWVITNSKNKRFKQIARLRAARVLIAQEHPKDALTLLSTVDDANFKGQIERVKGDAYAALNNKGESKKLYQEAAKNLTAVGLEDPLLKMEIAQP